MTTVPDDPPVGSCLVSDNTSEGYKWAPCPSSKKEIAWAAELRGIGKQKHLRWIVFCNDNETNPREYYIAAAYHIEQPIAAIYKEDGALPKWVVYGPTQEAAGRMLLKALDGAENYQPLSKPRENKPTHQCKSRVSGGFGVDDYADSDCKDCGAK